MAENQSATSAKPAESQADEFELTPEIMAYENRRTDLILAGGVLALAFFLGAFKDDSEDLWLRFKVGELIAQGFPNLPKTDTLSYTAAGKPWTNPSWLFDWSIYQIYARLGDAALVVCKSLVLIVVALCLLTLRHRGPTLWFASVCTLLALVSASSRLAISPEVPGLVLLGALLILWYQARHRQRFWLLYLAIPLTALWANVDMTFFLAPVVLGTLGVGELLQGLLPLKGSAAAGRWPLSRSLLTLGVGAASLCAGLATPYGLNGLLFPVRWFTEVLPAVSSFDRVSNGWDSLFGRSVGELLTDPEVHWGEQIGAFIDRLIGAYGFYLWDEIAWIFLAFLAFGSFFLNYVRLSAARVLLFLLALALPVLASRWLAPSALLLMMVVCLNGQEFFLDVWGTETRISKGWILWSQGGRALTIVLVFFTILCAFTGRVQQFTDRFGFGILEDRYMVAGYEWLKTAGFQGKPFCFVNRLSGYLAYADEQGGGLFVDSRWQLYQPEGVLAKFSKARRALNTGETALWKEVFDEYQITHVLMDPRIPALRQALLQMFESPELAPVHISDQVVIFGRTDPTVDLAAVERHRIEANRMVFRAQREIPPPPLRDLMAEGLIDKVWQKRHAPPPGYFAGLTYTGAALTPFGVRSLDRPGADYLAISRLRGAITENPDNPATHYQLANAYLHLLAVEMEQFVFADIRSAARGASAVPTIEAAPRQSAAAPAKPQQAPAKPATPAAPQAGEANAADKPANAAAATPTEKDETLPPATAPVPRVNLPVPHSILPMRHRQIMTEFQNALAAGGRDLQTRMHFAEYCQQNNFFDLALELQTEVNAMLPADRADQHRQAVVIPLELEVERRRARYDERVQQLEQQLQQAGLDSDRPIERAGIALQFQLPDLALEQLELASLFGVEMLQSAPFAGELYLLMGLPSKADEQFRRPGVAQQMEPGEWDRTMGHIRLLQGQYEQARDLFERSLAEIRRVRAARILGMQEGSVRAGRLAGVIDDAAAAARDLERESQILFELGLLRIEIGEPHLAPADFKATLALIPRSGFRPVINLYWSLITDERIPPEPPEYTIEDDVVQRFEVKSGDAKAKGGTAAGPPTSENAPTPQKPNGATKPPTTSEKRPASDSAPKEPQPKPVDASAKKAASAPVPKS